VGEKIKYENASLNFSSTDTYLTKVEPLMNGFYNVEITTIISPAGSRSAVGMFTFTTSYTLKEKDKITLYESNYFSSSTKTITLIVSKISNNEIEFSTISDYLNEE
jgi:hypothetical protein